MDTILETNVAVESVRQAYDGTSDRPRPEWVRGICPQCGDELVANCYYVGGRGYLVTRECWASLGDTPTCAYRKVL
jgi:hypothetical protein